MSLDYLCKGQLPVSVYCARRITAHVRCTQCSIQTCLCVVDGPGFVSTSHALMKSSATGSTWSDCPKNDIDTICTVVC